MQICQKKSRAFECTLVLQLNKGSLAWRKKIIPSIDLLTRCNIWLRLIETD
jgi:hypothetical protein